ncbi:MAG: glycosyltransferase [Candidatus Hodarchaeota archaeon]
MSVTIGIFVHNEIRLLERTLKSLKKNTNYPYQLIVVDDGSDKKTKAYLDSLSDITLITNFKCTGYPHCANIIMDYSETPYILYLDQASYVTEGWLTLLIESLEADLSHGIAGPSTSSAWGEQCIIGSPNWSESRIEKFGKEVQKRYGKQIKHLDVLHNVSGFCYCFKRDVFETIGYFDEAYGLGQCEDIDYNTRAAKAGFKCVWVCGAYVHRYPMQRYGSDSADLLQKNKRIYQNKFCSLQIEKHRSRYCDHCLGEESRYFKAPRDLKKVFRYPQRFTFKHHKDSVKSARLADVKEYPLISCIMPTSNRVLFVPKAIEYFLRQDYPNKELIIVDDGDRKIKHLVPSDPNVHYIELKQRMNVGEKRNIAIRNSHGQFIMHWDDDDWYAPNRIRYQIEALLQEKADLCALRPGLYYDIKEDIFWRCREDLHEKLYYGGIVGGSMIYSKKLWERFARFPASTNLGEDAQFLKQVPSHAKIVKLPNAACLIYVRHKQNSWEFTCGNDVEPSGWTTVLPPRELQWHDLEFYQQLRHKLFKMN